jgi:hypothetical protein
LKKTLKRNKKLHKRLNIITLLLKRGSGTASLISYLLSMVIIWLFCRLARRRGGDIVIVYLILLVRKSLPNARHS